jgi:DNA-binding CsgD family transcriptional regulator
MTPYPVQKAAIRAWVLTVARFGGDPEASLAAAGLSYAAIAGRGTVSWEAFRVFLAHSTAEKAPAEIESMGAEYTAVFPGLQALAGMLIPVDTLYHTTWAAERLWPMVVPVWTADGGNYLFEYTLRDGVAPSEAFAHATTGLLRGLSRRLGLPEAEVEVLHLDGRRALWRVRLPPQRLLYRRDGGPAEVFRWAAAGLRMGPRSSVPTSEIAGDAPSVATLASAHHLTLTEARIARHLAAGVPLAQTGKDLGLKASVVRGHLPEILGKLGTVAAPWAGRVRGVLEGAQP